MKILLRDSINNPREGLVTVADSAWRPDRRPLVVPEPAPGAPVQLTIRPAVHISRLGKNISPQFASRYYNSWAIVAVQERRAPDTPGALLADDSVVTGPWQPLDSLPANFIIGTSPVSIDIDHDVLASLVSNLSDGMTFKTGDVLVLPPIASMSVYSLPFEVEIISPDADLLKFTIR